MNQKRYAPTSIARNGDHPRRRFERPPAVDEVKSSLLAPPWKQPHPTPPPRGTDAAATDPDCSHRRQRDGRGSQATRIRSKHPPPATVVWASAGAGRRGGL